MNGNTQTKSPAPTKATFLEALEAAARGHHRNDTAEIASIMHKARRTIDGIAKHVDISDPRVVAAWKSAGLSGRPSYRALRKLAVS